MLYTTPGSLFIITVINVSFTCNNRGKVYGYLSGSAIYSTTLFLEKN